MKEKLPKKIIKYRAIIADLHQGQYSPLNGLFDSWPAAQSALDTHFKANPPRTVGNHDVGGYIERVPLYVAHNPKTDEDTDEPEGLEETIIS